MKVSYASSLIRLKSYAKQWHRPIEFQARDKGEYFDQTKELCKQWDRPIEFHVRDNMFLRVSPTRRVNRFGKKGKLSPRFVGPYEILERIHSLLPFLKINFESMCDMI